jgi:tetratricopeptide (TPR) repeat protein
MYLFYLRGDYQGALDIQKQFTDDAPIYIHSQRALLYAKVGQADSAALHIKQAARFRDDRPSHENYIYDICYAEYLLQMDSLQKAIRIGEQIGYEVMHHLYPLIIGMNYNMPFYRDVLPRSYRKAGQIRQAIAAYEELIDVDPAGTEYFITAPIYYYRLAQLHEELGDTESAAENYQRFLEFWNNADEDLPQKRNAQIRLSILKQ